MKFRNVIEINRTLTLQELEAFMQQHWDKTVYNEFAVGRPAAGAFKDYIMLPATERCVVCTWPDKGKVFLQEMTNPEGQMDLAGSLVMHGYGRMGMVGEMRGVAAQAGELYAAYLESLFAEAGMLSGIRKWKEPVLGEPGADGTPRNVLDLVKIAPPETRGISILSLVLGLASLILFFTGLPGLLLGIIAILTANSVLKNQGFQQQAYTGRFCAKVGVCMSAVVAFIFIVGSLITILYA